MRIASLHIYPVKSCRGIDLLEAHVREGGLEHDRRFMIVSSDGTFLTQREHPGLARIETRVDRTLRLGTDRGSVDVPLAPTGARKRVMIWGEHHEAVVVPEATPLLSAHLGIDCELVYMPDDVIRQVDLRYAKEGDRVGFADGFPILLATVASLTDLNARLDQAVPMSRFRPNIVVEGAADAFEEETHNAVRVGAISMRMPKRCSRCPIVTIDQHSGEMSKEPLRTLATYRTTANKVYFAQNCIPDARGRIAVGDPVRWL